MMRALRAWLARPASEHRWLVAALVAVVGFAAIAAVGSRVLDGDDRPRQHAAPAVSTPPAVIGAQPSAQRSTPAPDGAGVARPAARAFLTSYLAFLYGRGDADGVKLVSSAVRRELATNRPRVPPALRERRPRVIDLRVTRQAADAVLATATIDDGDVAVYPIVFTLDREAGGTWRVSRLAND